MSDSEDRTQAPSERRRQRAREEGEAPLSRELVVAGGLGAAALFLALKMSDTADLTARALRGMVLGLDVAPDHALRQAGLVMLAGLAPLMIGLAIAGAASVLLQTGFLLNPAALRPDFGRLDPQRGLKRLFGPDNLIETVKAVAKLGLLAWAVCSALSASWPVLPASPLWSASTLADMIGRGLVHLVLLVLAMQAGIALLDVLWTRWRFSQRLRMSREDLRQESKEANGDPRVKAKFRQLRLARVRRRMLAAVPKATVVITNPTHFAVALAYQRGGAAAPRIVAKGADEVAARIRAMAEKAGVPIVANPPLARALHRLPLDAEVPAEHFKAVAEIIAYVWRLQSLAPAAAAAARG